MNVRRLSLMLLMTLLVAIAGYLVLRYPAERQIEQSLGLIDRALRGQIAPAQARPAIERAAALSRQALETLPGDARATLAAGSAMTMLGQGGDALRLLEAQVARAERPELLVALGRARAAAGDDVGARAAFLRAAWASPPSITTLPRAVRAELLDEVARQDRALRDGQLQTPPPLRH